MREKDTVRPESYWLDEEQVEKVSDGIVTKVKPSDTGGPSFKSSSARCNKINK